MTHGRGYLPLDHELRSLLYGEGTDTQSGYVKGEDARLDVAGLLNQMRDAAAVHHSERNRWIQLFNKLEKHVSRHYDTKTAVGFNDDADDVLHKGWRQVLKDAQREAA